MRVLITDFNHDKKIQAMKGIRAVAYDTSLKAAKDLIDGPMPAFLDCRFDLTQEGIKRTLEQYGIEAHFTELPRAALRFVFGDCGQIKEVFVDVDGHDVASLSHVVNEVSFKSPSGGVGWWTIVLVADLEEDGDPLHKTAH